MKMFTKALVALSLTASVCNAPAFAKAAAAHPATRAEGITDHETLSGIHLRPASKGTFQLDFEQNLKEDALLKITDTSGRLVYQQPVRKAANRRGWRYNVGKLRPDTYLIEVKTSNTTYWTKFKVK